jgi:hypothetical protein
LPRRIQGGEKTTLEEESMAKIPWNINIEPLDMGFLVTVGCKKAAIPDIDTIVNGLRDLGKDPYQAQRDWFGSPDVVASCEPIAEVHPTDLRRENDCRPEEGSDRLRMERR